MSEGRKRTYAEAFQMLASLPRPVPEINGLPREQVEAYSQQIGISFPGELVDWLCLVNGVYVDAQALIGIGAFKGWSMEDFYTSHPRWLEKKYIPVALDGSGDYFVIVTNQEYGPGSPVVFMDQADLEKPAYIVASSFEIFVREFIRKEKMGGAWPFNPEAVSRIDPKVFDFKNIALPWEG